jgi:hypothetical protein
MTNWGIDIHDTPGHFRITIPPVARVTALPAMYRIATVAWLGFSAVIFTTVATAGPAKDGDLVGIISPVVQFTLIGVIIFSMAWYRLHRHLTIELTDQWLFLLNGDGHPTRRWRRADLIEIKANTINGKLVVRARDQEMRQLFIGADREMASFVADQLRAALIRPLPPSTSPPAEPAPAVPRPIEPTPTQPPATPFSSGQIVVGLGLATVAAISVLALALVSPTLASVLIGGCVLAAIPLGILLGTQDKDLWL